MVLKCFSTAAPFCHWQTEPKITNEPASWCCDSNFLLLKSFDTTFTSYYGTLPSVDTKNGNYIFNDFSRITFNFQWPPTRNVISQIVQECTVSVQSNRTLRLELFAPATSLSFQCTCLKLIVNYCIKQKALYVNHL